MKIPVILLTAAIAMVATPATAYLAFHRPTIGRINLAIWRVLSNEVHGGHYADVNNVRIYYETYGSGRPVLVLHGGAGALEDMDYQIRALAATRFVVAVDSRGHGRSTDTDAPLSYSQMADDMLKLLDRLDIRRTDIVGWSDGGIIGLDLAMCHPERVRRLVAIGANYDVDGLVERPEPDTAVPPMPRRYAHQAPDSAQWPVFYRKVATMWATQPNYTLADLGRIRAPTLIMAGEFDVIKREHTDRLAHAIPNEQEAIIPGGTHAVASGKPDVVNARMLRFLDQALPGS
jgi:pimeloyl-ACP methyl ester carboxylesterase